MDNELWYKSETPARDVLEVGKELWSKQGHERISLAEDSLALYLGSRRHSITGSTSASTLISMMGGGLDSSSTYNVIQAITDTKVSHTLRNRVRPLFITEGGDSDLKAKVEAMQCAVDGTLYGLGMQGMLGMQVCSSGYLFEAGGIEWEADVANSRIKATPVWPWDYFVSRREARYGNPRQLYSRQVVDRDVLLAHLRDEPREVRAAVEDARPATWEDVGDDLMRDPKRMSDMVVIYKSWHLPSGRVDMSDPRSFGRGASGRALGPGSWGHDGRHVVVIDGSDPDAPPLVDRPWAYDSYPISWFKPQFVPGSWWSRGVPEILAGTQIELNRWNARIMEILKLHARPLIFLSKQAKLNPAQITNALANIFQVEGQASQALYQVVAPAVPPDLVRRIQDITQSARDQLGMSEMSMAARKPGGINHEPGMAYLADTETIRHTTEFRAWEEFHLDCAKQVIRCFRQLAEYDEDFEVVFESDKQELMRQKWREMDVEADRYKVKAWPTNLLKQAPGQRADQIMDFVDRGLFSPEMALEALDAPDIKALTGDRDAVRLNIERKLDRIVKGTYDASTMPTPYMDLAMAKLLGMVRYNKLEANEEPQERVDRVVKFLEDVDALLQRQAPPVAPAGAPGAAPPQPPPQAPPLAA